MNKTYTNSDKAVWILLFIYIALSLIYAFSSVDTWDDDCPTRYYNTLNAFNEPIHFVSLWNRPLFTLIFAIPVQFGKFMIPILMVLISALGAFYLYKALKKQGIKYASLIIPLLLFQTYFFGISRNAETEPLAVAIFCFGYYFMVQKKWFWFALMAGLLPLARLELCVLFPFWAYVLFKEKQLKWVLVMILPLFLWNLAGAIITGNLTYLIDQTIGADNEKNRYGHTSFGHYFQRYIYAVGPVFFFFFILGIIRTTFTKIAYKGFVLFQFALGFFVYVLFSWKLNMGNAAGFMRNLTPLSTLGAIIALYGFNYWMLIINERFFVKKEKPVIEPFEELSQEDFHELNRKKRQAYIASKSKHESEIAKLQQDENIQAKKNISIGFIKYGLFILSLLVLAFITYKYFTLSIRSHHKLLEDTVYNGNLYVIIGLVLLTILLLGINKFKKFPSYIPITLIAVALMLFTAYTEPPNIELTPERELMTEVSDVFQDERLKENVTYVNHIWFYWANDVDRYGGKYKGVTMENLDSAAVGSICIWENHYSHRLSGDVRPEFFTKRKEWVRMSYYLTEKGNFRAMIYEKVDTLNPESTLNAIKEFAEIDPQNSDSWVCLANYYAAELKDQEKGLTYFQKAIDVDTLNHNAWFNRGIAWFAAKEYRPAKADFKSTLKIRPEWSDAWINLGATYSNLGEIDSAIFAYTNAINYNDKKPIAYLNRGKMYETKKDTMAALGDYSNYLKINKNDYSILWQRARLYAGLKSWKAADNDLRKLLKLRPEIKDAWLLLGICNLGLKNNQEAKNAFLRAQELGHPAAAAYIARYFSEASPL